MRKLRIFEHISLDGIISPRGDGHYANGGWTAPYRSDDGREAVAAEQGSDFDLLLGRRTYDLWSGFWPEAPKNPIADRLNAAKKYVATHRPEGLSWGPVESLGADLVGGVRRIKLEGDRDLIVWGSSTLTSVLLDQELVDEVVLFVYPVMLGAGKRLFSKGIDPRELALLSTKVTSSGVLVNVYRYVGPLRSDA